MQYSKQEAISYRRTAESNSKCQVRTRSSSSARGGGDDAPWIFVVHDQNPRALSPVRSKGFRPATEMVRGLTRGRDGNATSLWVYVGRSLLLAIQTLLGAS